MTNRFKYQSPDGVGLFGWAYIGDGYARFDVFIGDKIYRVSFHPKFAPIIKRPCGRGWSALKETSPTFHRVLSVCMFPAGYRGQS